MNSKNNNTKKGIVLEALPSMKFRVKTDDGVEMNAYLAGKLRIHRIKVFPGDKVTVQIDDYDQSKGRIVYRG